MVTSATSPESSGPSGTTHSARTRARQAFGFVPLALALVVTLVLGGASVARAVTVPPLDAQTDLEFSLDGTNWTDAPDAVLGTWGCDLGGTPPSGPAPAPGSDEAIGGSTGVDPCAMSPGEYIDRTYYVRNSTNTGRTGVYEVGIGNFELSKLAKFTVSSVITGATASGEGEYTLYGPETSNADETPVVETRLAALQLAPGASAKVVDTVSVPDAPNYEPDQSVSPRIWVKFSDSGDRPPGGGGSSDLPGIFWPIIVGGVIGVIVGIIAPWLGSSAGSVGGSAGGSAGGLIGSVGGIGPGSSSGSAAGSAEGSVGGSVAGSIGATVGNWISGVAGSVTGALGSLGSSGSAASAAGSAAASAGDDDGQDTGQGQGDGQGQDAGQGQGDGATGGAATEGSGPGDNSAVTGTVGQIPVETITPREASPSDEWARANSEVRSSLPTTGVGAADLLLWALTAAAAGATLILFAKRRRARGSED